MKTATPQLAAFLASTRQLVMADLYTITLSGGSVLRYTDAAFTQQDAAGNDYLPLDISRSGISVKRGVEVDSLKMTIRANESVLLNGVPLIAFIAQGGFDGATVLLQRAFAADWGQPLQGTLVMFGGRFGEVNEASRSRLSCTVNSWLELLNQQMPRNLYQAGCLHTLFDAACGLSRAAFTASGTAQAGSSADTVQASASAADGFYDLGTLRFTSGANTGVKRTVKRQLGAAVTVLPAFPFAPSSGDAYELTQGCDRSKATCATKFANLGRFRGFPFVPAAETSL